MRLAARAGTAGLSGVADSAATRRGGARDQVGVDALPPALPGEDHGLGRHGVDLAEDASRERGQPFDRRRLEQPAARIAGDVQAVIDVGRHLVRRERPQGHLDGVALAQLGKAGAAPEGVEPQAKVRAAAQHQGKRRFGRRTRLSGPRDRQLAGRRGAPRVGSLGFRGSVRAGVGRGRSCDQIQQAGERLIGKTVGIVDRNRRRRAGALAVGKVAENLRHRLVTAGGESPEQAEVAAGGEQDVLVGEELRVRHRAGLDGEGEPALAPDVAQQPPQRGGSSRSRFAGEDHQPRRLPGLAQ